MSGSFRGDCVAKISILNVGQKIKEDVYYRITNNASVIDLFQPRMLDKNPNERRTMSNTTRT